MARLTSPDPAIDQWLKHEALHSDLCTWIDEQKYVTKKVLGGMWRAFLASERGARWQAYVESGTEGKPIPVPVKLPSEPLEPEAERIITKAVVEAHTGNGGLPAAHTPPAANPVQEDLFGLLAKGLQGRLAPQGAAMDEERVKALIDYRLKEEALHKSYHVIVKAGDDVQQRLSTDTPMPNWFPRVYKQALCRVNTLLVGPRGCGKTQTAELLAKALKLPLYTISLSAGVDEGAMQGWLLPSKQGFWFEWVRSQFARAYTEGGVVLLDELDRADPNVLCIMHAALANGHWDIPLRGDQAEPLVKHDNFVCLAAANTHGHGADRVYVGANQLDGATLDRFTMGRVLCDYDEALETAAYPACVVEYGQRLRARCRAQKGWTRDVSTRNIVDAARLISQFSVDEAWYGFFEDWQDGELSKVGAVRDRVRQTVGLE